MITDIRLDSAMKDSDVEWLGKIPKHWEMIRQKHVCNTQTGDRNTIDQVDSGKYPFFVRSQKVARINTYSFDGEAVLTAGDGHIGKVFHYVDRKFDFHQRVYKFSNFRHITGKFFFHYARATLQHEVLRLSAKSTVDSIRLPMLQNFPVLSPPFLEQIAIVRFLDYVDRWVQRYVRTKQKLVKLLEEQKQAIIHQAVTHGLDLDVPLKFSGVEWLGDVPEHWELLQLGRIGSFSKGNGGTKDDEVDAGVPCVRYGDLYTQHQFFIHQSRSHVMEQKALAYTSIQYSDVLFAGSGETIEEIGKSAVNLMPESACCGGDVILFRPSIDTDAKFLGYVTDCPQAKHQKSCMGRGVTVMHIYGDELKYMFVALPPLPEQIAIVEYLDKETANIDTAISRARREIELLREYRTRLISDVVTGKIDVREAAANLPEETDESELLDEADDFVSEDEPTANDEETEFPEEAEA